MMRFALLSTSYFATPNTRVSGQSRHPRQVGLRPSAQPTWLQRIKTIRLRGLVGIGLRIAPTQFPSGGNAFVRVLLMAWVRSHMGQCQSPKLFL